ncbi:MAG: DUF131 domain-containing protein [Methanocellales archaeon]|nr:DUF131 domain-containing protein [Methanocellales archaeon]
MRRIGYALIALGFVALIVGVIMAGGEFGGFVMIGPIPVAFGSSPQMIIIAMCLGLTIMLLYIIAWRR